MHPDTTTSTSATLAARITGKRWTHILIPLLFLYLVNFVDRNNISFAVIGGMNADLHINNAQAGLASGVFYIGYLILQIPGGVLAERFDAKWIIAIMGTAWGIMAVVSALAQNLPELLILRFLLGLVEGGVWPAIMVLLSRWFTDRERATANSIWLLAMPASFVVMGPISGLILQATSWRWLFVVEGVPAVLFALLVLAVGAAKPEQARWLPEAEREYIRTGRSDTAGRVKATGYRQAILHPQVLLLSALYLFWLIGAVGFFTWMPAIVKQISAAGLTSTGFLSALPYLASVVGLVLVGRLADRKRRRKIFLAADLACLAVSLWLSTLVGGNEIASMTFVVLSGFFLFAMHAPFWSIPMETLPPHLVGAAIGTISLIGNIGSFVGPYLMGYVQQTTGSFTSALYVLIGSLVVSVLLTLFVRENRNTVA